QFLKRSESDVAGEAALALGGTRDPRALTILFEKLNHTRDPGLVSVLLTSIALTNLLEALDFLIGLIARDEPRAGMALEGLAAARLSEDARTRLSGAVTASGNPRLQSLLAKLFRQ